MAETFDVAVVDEDVWLYIAEELSGAVTVSFSVMKRTNETDLIEDFWEENLESEPAPRGDSGAPPEARSRIRWHVKITKPGGGFDPTASHPMPRSSRGISATVFGGHNVDPGKPGPTTKSYRVLRALKIPGFAVTDKPRIRKIMIHEFGLKKGGGKEDIDEDKVYAFFDALTVQQRRVLATYDVSPFGGNRIVMFFTLQPDRDLRLHMEDSYSVSHKSNATMMAFHCKGPGEDVTLVTGTHFIFIGANNQKTRDLLLIPSANGDPQQWLRRDNPKPPVFRLSAICMPDSFIWFQLHSAKGAPAMRGNFIHGTVATHGCWSLFKNFHFHASKTQPFDAIVVRYYRGKMNDDEAKKKLAKHGYDVKEHIDKRDPVENGTERSSIYCDSLGKFFRIERNWAYVWFTREVAGIRYFSRGMHGNTSVQDRYLANIDFEPSVLTVKRTVSMVTKPDGSVEEQVVSEEVNLKADFVKGNGDPRPSQGGQASGEPRYIFHSIEDRRKTDPNFKLSDDLWTENELGFKTASGFAGINAHLASSVHGRTWADCFFFRADDLDVKTIRGPYVVKPPEAP